MDVFTKNILQIWVIDIHDMSTGRTVHGAWFQLHTFQCDSISRITILWISRNDGRETGHSDHHWISLGFHSGYRIIPSVRPVDIQWMITATWVYSTLLRDCCLALQSFKEESELEVGRWATGFFRVTQNKPPWCPMFSCSAAKSQLWQLL